jgi:DNA-binding NarL/FixJ family response regulator
MLAEDEKPAGDRRDHQERIQVLLVDDHTLLRDGLRDILTAESDILVVGEAANGRDALRYVVAESPDVVVLDVGIPGDSVTRTVSDIQRVAPKTSIIILSVYDDPPVVRELLGMGVRGYLLKSVSRQDFVLAVRAVVRDADRVVVLISQQSLQQLNNNPAELLSPREREIMSLVAAALSNSQIAHRLGITEGTVKRHLRNIFTKLGAVSRIDAVNKAGNARQLPTRRS